MRFSPSDFWQASPREITTAMDGLAQSRGYSSKTRGQHSLADLKKLALEFKEKENGK